MANGNGLVKGEKWEVSKCQTIDFVV